RNVMQRTRGTQEVSQAVDSGQAVIRSSRGLAPAICRSKAPSVTIDRTLDVRGVVIATRPFFTAACHSNDCAGESRKAILQMEGFLRNPPSRAGKEPTSDKSSSRATNPWRIGAVVVAAIVVAVGGLLGYIAHPRQHFDMVATLASFVANEGTWDNEWD